MSTPGTGATPPASLAAEVARLTAELAAKRELLRTSCVWHSNQHRWWRYWLPRQLTVNANPPIWRWLFWAWEGKERK